MLTATAHAAEVSGLKQSLERVEEELGRVKKQLEDKPDSATHRRRKGNYIVQKMFRNRNLGERDGVPPLA